MQALLGVPGLDQLSLLGALRLGGACRDAREALGADGVTAAALACARSVDATNRLGSWRKRWAACAEVARVQLDVVACSCLLDG